MPCQQSSIDLPWVLRIWESIFYFQAFFTLHSFLLILRISWSQQFNIKVSRASCWSLKLSPGPTIALIRAIHKKGIMLGSIYVPKATFGVRTSQLWNLSLTRFEPAFLKVPYGSSQLPWRIGHRILWILTDG